MIDASELFASLDAQERAATASAGDFDDFIDANRIDFATFAESFWDIVNPGAPYMPNWHLEAIAHRLQQCAERKIKRLIINLPPRHGKSYMSSMAFPAWVLGQDPTARVIAVAYGEDLAGEHARGCMAIMKSSLYREVFPNTRVSAKRSRDDDFQTTERGGRLATTVGGALTGRGGSFIIIDDPIKASDVDSEVQRKKINDWYDNTLTSRLDQPKDDVIVLVMQRVHVDDMAGKLIQRGGFEVLNLAAIAPADETIEIGQGRSHTRLAGVALHPERMPLELLEERRLENPIVFDSQYQQDPSSSSDAPFKFSDFRRMPDKRMLREPDDYHVISWDTAVKTGSSHDYSVGVVIMVQYSHLAPGNHGLRDARFCIKEVFRARLDYEHLIEAMVQLERKYKPRRTLVENTHLIEAIKHGMRGYNLQAPTPVTPVGDKRSRLWAQAPYILQGRVCLPEDAPWLPAFQREFEAFPNGQFDDQVDAFSQFLSWVTKQLGAEVFVYPYG